MDIFDSLLTLEEDYYKDGYEEGVKDGKQAGYLEGKGFGIQTGFQRFVTLGILQGRLAQWRRLPQNDRLTKHLDQLHKLICDIPLTNSPEDVEQFSQRLKKAKAKAKVIMSVTKDPVPLNLHDNTVALREIDEVIEDV